MSQLLRIWILNVGHGDSIVIQYTSNNDVAYGVIDSNRRTGELPPALEKLKELQAKSLSFIALTHPHADHYSGLLDIYHEYEGRIKTLYTYPIDYEKKNRLRKYAEMYQKICRNTDDYTIREKCAEFIKLLHAVNTARLNKKLKWEIHYGPKASIFPDGFTGVDIEVLLPLAKCKGAFFQSIDEEKLSNIENQQLNDLSIGMRLTFQGVEIILGGDCTQSGWQEHERAFEKGGKNIAAKIVKISHHGSKKDFNLTTLKYLYTDSHFSGTYQTSNQREMIAAISADGRTHPHVETLRLLKSNRIAPYCTNLHSSCGAITSTLISDDSIEPELKRFIQSMLIEPTSKTRQPCQGSICIEIENNQYKIIPQYAVPCPYRGDYERLSSIT